MSSRRGWIKICGLRSREAVEAALAADADALGFVFAPSVRRVSTDEAKRLAASVRGKKPCVAVMQHPSAAEVLEVLASFEPDLLQTDHGDADLLPPAARARLLPVYRESEPLPVAPPARLLFEGKHSGSGRTADWQAARALAARTELLLAGGLNADNVADAIRSVRPFGVDVSSGVESAPGIKSVQRIHEFVRAARMAFGELTA